MTIWQEQLDRLRSVIAADIARGDYFGMVLKIGHAGEVVFEEAIGHAYAGGERALQTDDVFSLFSVTKAFTKEVADSILAEAHADLVAQMVEA